MRKKNILLFLCGTILSFSLRAQELQASISVLAGRIPSTVDHKIFQTLQTSLYNFVNNRKWSGENFQNNEKIVCNFLVNISASGDNNTYTASMTVQAGRPVFNSSYQSPLINFQDETFTFRYVEYQSLDFNENRVQGTEPYAANLTAQFAYYIDLILGLYFDSFSQRGGDTYFQKALNIVENAPEGANITGWKAFDGVRNRYWLIENFTNSKYTLIHDAYYTYFRQGLDLMYDKETDARGGVLNALNMLNTINTETSTTMIIPFFFQSRSTELSKMFKNAAPDEKSRAVDLLSKMDISNANKYKQELQ